MAVKGSVVKKSISIIFATDERKAILSGLIASNLNNRIKVEFPNNNGLEAIFTYETRFEKDLFVLGRCIGQREQNKPHQLKKSTLFKCDKCNSKNRGKLTKNLCQYCEEAHITKRNEANEEREKKLEKYKPPEIPTIQQATKSIPKFFFNPNNFKPKE